MRKKNDQLALFAKYWQPGKVKTRLAAKIGEIAASEVYLAFLTHLLHKLKDSGDQRTVFFAPPECGPEFEKLVEQRWTLSPQSSGGLGERLVHCSQSAFQTQSSTARIVIIGSDCLDVDEALIQQAFNALDENQIVLGPSHDGGYYLIGMSEYLPGVFEDIAWSTESVLAQTQRRIRDLNLSCFQLPTLNDIDEVDDLIGLQKQLTGQGSPSSDSERLLAAVNSALNSQ